MNRKSISAATFAAVYMPIVTLLGSIGASIVLWKGGSNLMVGTLTYGTRCFYNLCSAVFLSY